MSFPIHRVSERRYPPGWSGEVFVCDIDRTYLATRFSSLRGLMRIPFEFAVDKQDIDGMVALLREVRRGPNGRSRQTPLYFVSASPAQLRRIIERKMLLDGLEFDGTTFKDWTRSLRSGRFRRLREQLGFKLTALVAGRADLPQAAQEVLIGDDLESDALAFTLYADLLNGAISEAQFARVLSRRGVMAEDVGALCRRRSAVSTLGAPVKRGYLRMERFADPDVFRDYAPLVVACRSALQMALGLLEQESIGLAGLVRVAADLAQRGMPPAMIAAHLGDAVRRGLVGRERAAWALGELAAVDVVSADVEIPTLDRSWGHLMRRHEGTATPVRELCA